MKTTRFRTISVRISATAAAGLEFGFQDQEDLKTAIIDGIETFTATDQAVTEDGQAVVTDADAVKLCLYLAEDSNDKEKAIPYLPQRTAINAGVVREYNNLVCNFPQSRLRVTQAFAAVTETFALIGVHFHYPKDLV